jgi:hypothetical protein
LLIRPVVVDLFLKNSTEFVRDTAPWASTAVRGLTHPREHGKEHQADKRSDSHGILSFRSNPTDLSRTPLGWKVASN